MSGDVFAVASNFLSSQMSWYVIIIINKTKNPDFDLRIENKDQMFLWNSL